jgi:hypothetical protein
MIEANGALDSPLLLLQRMYFGIYTLNFFERGLGKGCARKPSGRRGTYVHFAGFPILNCNLPISNSSSLFLSRLTYTHCMPVLASFAYCVGCRLGRKSELE